MLLYRSVITLFWFIFIVYWVIASFSVKKNVQKNGYWFAWRILFIVLVILVVRSNAFNNFDATFLKHTSSAINFIGIAVCALGIGFAMWARVYLGENWGTPMSVKEDTELVTDGPYKYVRHPIYAGVLIAMIGSALAGDAVWLVTFIIVLAYFAFMATREEKHLTEVFPEKYPAYKKRTKMLLPFIF